MILIADTIAFMKGAHFGQLDKAGVDYYHHPLRVMARLGRNADEHEQHAALLHDVVEDTDVTLDELREMGYPEFVVGMVDLLSKRKGEKNAAYIDRLIQSGSVGAMRIKVADCYDNGAPSRLRALPYGQQEYLSHKLAENLVALRGALFWTEWDRIIEGDL